MTTLIQDPPSQVYTRVKVLVFGSNTRGIHGRGAALDARREWGAVNGHGRGMQPEIGVKGKSWAIPTKDKSLLARSISLKEIRIAVNDFLDYVYQHPEEDYLITRIGCGLAGFTDDEIRPMFEHHPSNCYFDSLWGFEKSWGTGSL